jgi:hypothetical protein
MLAKAKQDLLEMDMNIDKSRSSFCEVS